MVTTRFLNYVLPVIVIAGALLSARVIQANRPVAISLPETFRVLVVEAIRLQPDQYPVMIRSQGTVQPTIRNALVPEVAGKVTDISTSFQVGGRFRAGDVLLEIDRRDYQIALTQAVANLAQANAQLQEQSALAQRAQAEWDSLGRRGTPSALTLREPQLAAASANRDAAQAQVERAQLDLERTQLVAPYDGIVSERQVNPGQFVTRGTPIGEIYGVASIDIPLPLSSWQLTYLDTRGEARVDVSAIIGNQTQRWTGKLIRVEGLNPATQQLTVIARIADPYRVNEPESASYPLRVGQFVQAQIAGLVLDDVFVIPRSALREEREVLLLTDKDTIERREVTIAWSDENVAAVSAGLNSGDFLVTTPLNTVANGTPVSATIAAEVLSSERVEDNNHEAEQREKLN